LEKLTSPGFGSRRALKGVLYNFLGTYTSRYSDFGGFWLFGLLVDEPLELHVDLLSPIECSKNEPEAALIAAIRLARQRFQEQLVKAGCSRSLLHQAYLDITRLPDLHCREVCGVPRYGYNLRFSAKVISDRGKSYQREKIVFVAPHDSHLERRAARTNIKP
jgi:hypothetical protein